MEALIFNSRKREFKTPFGCVYENENIKLNVKIRKDISDAEVILYVEGEKSFSLPLSFRYEEENYNVYGLEFSIDEKGLYFYHFTLNGEMKLNKGAKWQISVLQRDYETPDYLKGAVIYQIFPDRFSRSGRVNTKGKLEPFYMHEDLSDMPEYRPINGEVLNYVFRA